MESLIEEIAECIRSTLQEVRIDLDNAYLVVPYWSELANRKEVMAMPVIVTTLESSFDYFIGFNDPSDDEIKFIKEFRETLYLRN